MTTATGFFSAMRRFVDDCTSALASRGPIGDLVVRARHDEALRRRLCADPSEVLSELGISLPPGITVKVVQNTPTEVHIVLPPLVAGAEPGSVS
jgi:hypothetical protein